jgi:UDP-N-acetylmuramate dehydrogenase
MDEGAQLEEISSVLRRAGVIIRVEPFQEPSKNGGGLCKVHGKDLVILDSRASRPEQLRALLEVIEDLGLESLGVSGKDLSPELLSALSRRGKMSWPHKRQAPSLKKARADRHRAITPRLADHTTMAVGGRPDHFIVATSAEEVLAATLFARERNLPLHPLGGGSNLVVSDDGVRGVVLKISLTGIDITHQGDDVLVTAAAGEIWHDFAAQMTDEGWAGMECLGGIPGAVGATPIQNVGAYGQEVADTIHRVQVLDRVTLQVREMPAAECHFVYRGSVFKAEAKDRYVVLAVTFRLRKDAAPTIRYGELSLALGKTSAAPTLAETFRTVVNLRRAKSMVLDPNDENRRSCGSFFVNAQVTEEVLRNITEIAGEAPPHFPGEHGMVKVPSAWLIERAGLTRGLRRGHAGLSSKHTLSIVAHDGALARDVVDVARFVRETVESRFAVRLMPEPHFWGFGKLEDGLPVL